MADRIWSVLRAFCRWWFFGAVLGVVIGGGVGSAVLLPPSAVVDRIWPGLVGFAVTAALGCSRIFAGRMSETDLEDIALLLGSAAASGAVSSWFGVAVTRRVRIPLPVVVLSAPALGVICAVGGVLSGLLHDGASEPDIIAMSMLMGLACGGILGAVLIVFNQLIAEEPSAT